MDAMSKSMSLVTLWTDVQGNIYHHKIQPKFTMMTENSDSLYNPPGLTLKRLNAVISHNFPGMLAEMTSR